MAEIQLYYIGTSKIKEIRAGGSVTFDWGSYGPWTNFKKPVAASKKEVKYNKKTKNAVGSQAFGGNGGVTVLGTAIPRTATKVVQGVERTVDVRYWKRGYTIYTRTSKLTKKKKMARTKYTTAKPYQYRLQYKDKPIVNADYSSYANGVDYIYFADHYYNGSEIVPTTGHLPHPVDYSLDYSEVRRNFDTSSANNNDGRDNKGSYVLSNVRRNLVTLELGWKGLKTEEGADLLDTLNPTASGNYLTVQYLDPATNKVKNGTFFAGNRAVTKYSNGVFKEIKVTLTEV